MGESRGALAREHGKAVGEARGEIHRGIENVEVAAGVPNMLREGSGTVKNVADGIDESAVRQPLGVFTAIVPFDFPVDDPAVVPSLRRRDGEHVRPQTVRARPLEFTAHLRGRRCCWVPRRRGEPRKWRRRNGETLLEHEDIEGVSFVGSHVYETAATAGKRVQAQRGAKNYAVVTKSAELDRAMPNVLGSVYGNTDQRCLANEVVIDVGDVNDELQECLIEGAEEMTVGVGLNEGTDVGPVITSDARDRISDLVDGAVEEGTELVLDRCDFEHPEHPDGNFVTGDMTIAQEEIFGPVLCLASGDGLDEAIEMVNGTRYGNASSIYTERGGEARRYRYKVDAGNIGINVGVCA